MNYKNYLEAARQGYEDPTEYEPVNRYCEICDIEEIKTYFVEDSNICEECFYSCCGDKLNQDIRICKSCGEHN